VATIVRTLRVRDPGLRFLARAVRAAVVVPAVFAVARAVTDNPQVSLFASFGSFALLLMVEFIGRPATRLWDYCGLWLAGAVLVTLGTLCSQHGASAVVGMAVVAFVILFAGVASPAAATGATAALLTFVLPVTIPAAPSEILPRLAGWLLAGAVCIPACLLVWPPPGRDDLRRKLGTSARALADVVAAHGRGERAAERTREALGALRALRATFESTPYSPTGPGRADSSLCGLVGRMEWVGAEAMGHHAASTPVLDLPAVRAVYGAVAAMLGAVADVVTDRGPGGPARADAVRALEDAAGELTSVRAMAYESAVHWIDEEGPSPAAVDGDADVLAVGELIALDPTLHTRVLGLAAELTAQAALRVAGVDAGGSGHGPRRVLARLRATAQGLRAVVVAHTSMRSVWLRNSLRGAAGLALAVFVVEVARVDHGFWVALGVMSVLRSHAMGTGATAGRALLGTVAGFVVGAVVMLALGSHTALLWAVLPVAVLFAGYAPSVISFAAGQAGFTVVVIVLFNIIMPTGWTVGLVRIEDVAIGCLIALAVGLLFWPRGATAALGRALAESYSSGSAYLTEAIDRSTDPRSVLDIEPVRRQADAAYRRLDDSFRQYLAERGAKRVPVHTLTDLVTGATRLRLSAFSLGTVPTLPVTGGESAPAIAAARAVLVDTGASASRWCERMAEVLTDGAPSAGPVPDPPDELRPLVLGAFTAAREQGDAGAVRTCLRILLGHEDLVLQQALLANLADVSGVFVRSRQRWWA
jgi:uncharacterized membrane protein YccC